MSMSYPWRDVVVEPLTREHFVQVYRDERVLLEAVSLFASAALGRREAVVLVATRPHADGVRERLIDEGFDVEQLQTWGQLTLLNAEDVLSRFMVDGMPDPARFKAVIGEVIGAAKSAPGLRAVRVYGEMVNLLWTQNLPAATRLEELWNEVIEEHSISLFCSYCVSGGAEGEAQRMFPPDLRALHTHFIPLEASA